MTDAEFEALAAAGLDVAFGIAPWAAFGERVRQALDTSAVTLLVGPADGSHFVDLMQPDAAGESEAARFNRSTRRCRNRSRSRRIGSS